MMDKYEMALLFYRIAQLRLLYNMDGRYYMGKKWGYSETERGREYRKEMNMILDLLKDEI